MRSRLRALDPRDDDPLEGVANFFDLGIVFALGFMIMLMSWLGVRELLDRGDATLVKEPGTPRMELIRKKGTKIERYRISMEKVGGEGEKLGTAYRLKSGEVVYVPEGQELR